MQRERVAALKQRLARNELVVGSWINIPDPAVVEVMATAGFDWLVIDLEHTTTSLPQAIALIRTIEAEGMVPLVRLTSNDANQIKRVMDAGAGGVVVPMVGSATAAAAAVSAVRYPPQGTRGVGLARAQRYGVDFAEYLQFANRDTIVIVQIEHINAIRDLEGILKVPGVDGSIIGPYDLSGSLGKPGQLEDPDVLAALATYEATSRRLGVPMGYHVVDPDPAKAAALIQRGYRFLAYGVDFTYLGSACRGAMQNLRKAL